MERINGRVILAKKPFSTHPGDWYLEVHLAVWYHEGSEYKPFELVRWTYNKQNKSHFWGHYWHTNIEGAVKDYNEAGKIESNVSLEEIKGILVQANAEMGVTSGG
jgi:hypothetical protein